MNDGCVGLEPDRDFGEGTRKMSESELSDYRLSVMARSRGCNVHKINNALAAVVMTNEFNMFTERDEKMRFISGLLA